jgi:hypothetical protein
MRYLIKNKMKLTINETVQELLEEAGNPIDQESLSKYP